MKPKPLNISFTETAEQEINALVTEMNLVPLARYITTNQEVLPAELKGLIGPLLSVIMDIFSTETPTADIDPEATLRSISRDINLARLLRERGLFRLYRLLHLKTPDGVPIFMTVLNPDTGNPFSKQEDFIGWFCSAAKVARSLVFMRLMTIDRTIQLGFTLDDAFGLIVTKPWVIRETLNMVASWEKAELVHINPEVAVSLAERLSPSTATEIKQLAADSEESPESKEKFLEASKPVIANLLREVASHEHSKDALDFVRHDLLRQPEINYLWDEEGGYLVVEMVRIQVDDNGNESIAGITSIPFVPEMDEGTLPAEILRDLLKRLPIKNRNTLYN